MNETIQITKYITNYLNGYIQNNISTSENTLKSYKLSLKLYLEYLETININITNITYDCFKKEKIENWLTYLKNTKNNQNQTINLRLTGIKIFLEFLGKKDISLLYLYTEASTISKRKIQKVKVKGLSKKAIKVLFESINQFTITGKRDITLFVLMYNTGTRLNEILSLKLKDIKLNVTEPYINIIGKGNKLRSLYILPKTVEYLSLYIKENHKSSSDNDYLFYSKVKGKQCKLSEQSIEKQLKKYAKIAHQKLPEIPLNVHPHQLRHSAATHWLDDGMNIVQISYLLGHEQLQTTMVYLEITTAQKAEALKIIDDSSEEKKWKQDISKLTDLCK